MLPTSVLWDRSPRILSEDLQAPVEPLALLLRPGAVADAGAVVRRAARALLDLPEGPCASWPSWLPAHPRPAAGRLAAILDRYGGALLADAVGLGKSYVALAVALARREPFALAVPAVLAPQWRALLAQHNTAARIITHESLSTRDYRLPPSPTPYRLLVVDEAHRFRNPALTNRGTPTVTVNTPRNVAVVWASRAGLEAAAQMMPSVVRALAVASIRPGFSSRRAAAPAPRSLYDTQRVSSSWLTAAVATPTAAEAPAMPSPTSSTASEPIIAAARTRRGSRDAGPPAPPRRGTRPARAPRRRAALSRAPSRSTPP